MSNETILKNIRRAADECARDAIHVRIPLVWGVNDSTENIRATAEFCRDLPNCAELEFLPYHRLGKATYGYLDREYKLKELPVMTRSDVSKKVAFLSELDLPFPLKVSGDLDDGDE